MTYIIIYNIFGYCCSYPIMRQLFCDLDPSPVSYKQKVGGIEQHRSGICGFIALAFWAFLGITFYYKIFEFAQGSLNYVYQIDQDLQVDLEQFINFQISLLDVNKNIVTFIDSDSPPQEYGLKVQCISDNKIQCRIAATNSSWSLDKMKLSNPGINLFKPNFIQINLCNKSKQAICQNSFCQLDPKYKYLKVSATIDDPDFNGYSHQFDIKNQICSNYQGGFGSTFIINKQSTQYDYAFLNIGNIQFINQIFGTQDYHSYFQTPALGHFRSDWYRQISTNESIIEFQFEYSGRVMNQKWSRAKFDDVVPPILGFFALFSTIFYGVTSSYKLWCVKMNITRQIYKQEVSEMVQPSILLWITQKTPLTFTKTGKKLDYTKKKMQKIDEKLDLTNFYRQHTRLKQQFQSAKKQLKKMKVINNKMNQIIVKLQNTFPHKFQDIQADNLSDYGSFSGDERDLQEQNYHNQQGDKQYISENALKESLMSSEK